LGRTKEGQARLEEALALYKLPVSHSWGQVLPDIVKQLVRQLGYRLFPTRIGRLEGARRDRHLAASNAYERLSQIYYFQNRVALFLRATLHSVNMAEKAGVSPEMGRGYANLSVATSNVPVHRWAEYYSQHARAVTNQVNDPNAKSWAFLLAGVYYSGIGAWDKAGTVLDESIDTAKQAGDARQWEMSMCVRGLGLRYRGRYEESLTYSKGCYPSSLSRGDLQAQSWALLGQLQNVIPLGRMGEVPALIQKLLPMLDENLEMDVKQDVRGQLADAYLRLGDRGKAFALVQAAAPIMAQQRMPANFYLLAGYTGISQTIFTLWDEAIAVGSTDQAQLVQLAEQAVQGWKFFARVFPVGKPAYYIVRGQLARRLGQVEKARGFLQEGMENAGILQMPLEAKLAQQEIEKLQVS
jgi:tetratricopeptide (TPR) repeat protein